MKTKEVIEYIASQPNYRDELTLLRSVLLELQLEETIKWGIPTYMHKGKNILGMSAFKNYFGLWFHHGVFLKDEAKLLINAQKDKTKGMRQMRYTKMEELNPDLIKRYVLETMKNSELGKDLKPTRNATPVILPEELQHAFTMHKDLQQRFEDFSLSKKREFCEYISEAKKAVTKQKRLQKIIPMILNQVGLNDQYKK